METSSVSINTYTGGRFFSALFLVAALFASSSSVAQLLPTQDLSTLEKQILLAKKAFKERDMDRAFELLQYPSELGHAEAQMILATIYIQGTSKFGINTEKAFFWLEKSAKGGLANAQYLLGLSYLNGHLTDVNAERAKFWLLAAARQGHAKAKAALSETIYKKNLQGPYVHHASNMIFPENMGPLKRGIIATYDEKAQNISVDYTSDHCLMTIFIHPAGYINYRDRKNTFNQEFLDTIQGIVTINDANRLLEKTITDLDENTLGREALFQFKTEEKLYYSLVRLYYHKGWSIKYRVSYNHLYRHIAQDNLTVIFDTIPWPNKQFIAIPKDARVGYLYF